MKIMNLHVSAMLILLMISFPAIAAEGEYFSGKLILKDGKVVQYEFIGYVRDGKKSSYGVSKIEGIFNGVSSTYSFIDFKEIKLIENKYYIYCSGRQSKGKIEVVTNEGRHFTLEKAYLNTAHSGCSLSFEKRGQSLTGCCPNHELIKMIFLKSN